MGVETGKEKTIDEIAPEAMERLKNYDYPGNVRELRNIIKRALVVATGGRVELVDLPKEIQNPETRSFAPEIRVPISEGLSLFEVSPQAVIQIERQLILEAILKSQGHHGRAATLLGVAPQTLYNKMKEYGISG
jgi:DNA-binding NtrC family response regulator